MTDRRLTFLRHWLSAGVLSLSLAPGGCVAASGGFSHADFDRLPRDARQEIFDAENDLVIARNRQDAAEDRNQKARRASTELELRWRRVNQRLGATGQAARAPLARKVFDAQSTYLDSEVRLTNEEIRAAHMETELSRARLALARQRNLARVGRVTGASLKPFEESVKAWEAASKAASVATTAVRTRAESDLDAWKTAEDEYARASGGDYDTVVWGD